MKVVNIFFIVLFIASAALQYNDPDPLLWMPVYLFGAFLCIQALRGHYNIYLYMAGLGFYIAFSLIVLLSDEGPLEWFISHRSDSLFGEMKAAKPWIEETREFLGLFLLIVALTLNLVTRRRKFKL